MASASDYEKKKKKKKSDFLVAEVQIYMIAKDYLEMGFQLLGVSVETSVTPLKSC